MRPRRSTTPRGVRAGGAAAFLTAALAAASLTGCPVQDDPGASAAPALPGEVWRGPAIAYSGYRAGQSPASGVRPSREQVAEDLGLLARRFRLIRVYSADRHSEDVLEVIRENDLDLRVMLGIWLAREPGAESANARQVEEGIRLARAYEDIVVAVNVGNEVLIEWTEHPVPEERVIGYVRRVKAAVAQPVTVADNYVWWRDHGSDLAQEVDFIAMHSYPLWERRDIDEGLSYTIANYEDVRAAHPDKPVVIGEAGWATYTEGNLHVPRGGDERKQARYFEELSAWSRERGVTVFFFEAFDEPWKGTGTEGHWGLFTVDREAKPAIQAWYPDRSPDGPTSPAYPDRIGPTGPPLAVVLASGLAARIPGGSVNPLGPGLESHGVVEADGAEGGTALSLEFTGESWAGVYVLLDGYDVGAADAVALRLRLPDGVAGLELKLEGPESHAGSVDLFAHAAGTDDAGWATFVVPLSAFEEVDRTRMAVLGLWNPQDRSGARVAGTILVDDVRFVGPGG